jgi:hypothetical protein
MDYHLFRSLQNSLDGRRFKTLEDLKNHIKNVLDSKPSECYRRGISQLTERWEKAVREKRTIYF